MTLSIHGGNTIPRCGRFNTVWWLVIRSCEYPDQSVLTRVKDTDPVVSKSIEQIRMRVPPGIVLRKGSWNNPHARSNFVEKFHGGSGLISVVRDLEDVAPGKQATGQKFPFRRTNYVPHGQKLDRSEAKSENQRTFV